MVFRIGAALAVLGCVTVAGVFFPLGWAVWLAGLALLAALRPTWAAATLIVGLPIDQVRPVAGIQVSFSEFQLAVLLLAFLGRSEWRRLDWRPLVWGLPFVGAVAVSGLIHIEPHKVLPHCVRASEMLLACFLAGNAFGGRERDRETALAATAAAALVLTLVGAGQLFFPWGAYAEVRPERWGVNQMLRPGSLLGNANQFAGLLLLLLPFAQVRWAACAGRTIRFLWADLVVVMLGGIALTGSRAGLAAAAVSGLAAYLLVKLRARSPDRSPAGGAPPPWWRRRGAWWTVHAAAVVLLVAGGLSMTRVREPLQRLLRNVELRSAGGMIEAFQQDRLPHIRAGWRIWMGDPLFGVGPGNWEESLKAYAESQPEGVSSRVALMVHAHNLFIQTGAELGLAGLAGLLFWWGRLAWRWRRRRDLWSLSGLALLAGFFFFGLFDVLFPSLAMEFGWLLGLAWSGGAGTESFAKGRR